MTAASPVVTGTISIAEAVKVAEGENGYNGGGTTDSPITKYAAWYGFQDSWCAMFVSWVLADGGTNVAGSPIAGIADPKGFAYCPDGENWFKKQGTYFTDFTKIQAGDIGFQQYTVEVRASHTWICVGPYDPATGTFPTVQGNTGSGDSDESHRNGNTVRFKQVSAIDPHNRGYGRPVYTGTGTGTGDASVLVGGGQGDSTVDSTGMPLDLIKQLPDVKPIPYKNLTLVNARNMLASIRLSGLGLSTDLAARCLSAQMQYSSTQVGQLALTIQDTPDARYLASGVLEIGTSVDFGDQHMDLRSVNVTGDSAGAPQIQINCRSRVITSLRDVNNTGAGTWGILDLEQWVKDRAAEVGARAIVQPHLADQIGISRQAGASGTVETTGDVFARLATAVGAWFFEYDQWLVLARPSWLAARAGGRRWPIRWKSTRDHSANLKALPGYNNSGDGNANPTLSFTLLGGDADEARPGDFVSADLPGSMTGDWIISTVTQDIKNGQPPSITCDRIIDPIPAQTTATGGG